LGLNQFHLELIARTFASANVLGGVI